MKHILMIALAGVVLAGCTTAKLAPAEQRRAEYIEKTDVKKADAYHRAVGYLAKTLGDANHAIKVRDEGTGQVISQGRVVCNTFQGASFEPNYYLEFNLDFQAKDNRVKISFEDMEVIAGNRQPAVMDMSQLVNAKQVERAKECIAPVKDGLMSAINAKGSNKDW